ncbi:MAG: Minf_1886 family protein [Planctomycetota bacterium]
MSSEKEAPPKSLCDIARRSGPYPEAAYHFVREGLEYAAQAVHGAVTPEQQLLAQYMAAEKIDFEDVLERHARGELDPAVAAAIDQAGGPDKVNRNVSGEALCWALRDFAVRRWGGLAGMVLGQWHIRSTEDFGRIVFAMVEHGVMQKESHDSIDHFKNVFDFTEAFDRSFRFFDGDGREAGD